MAASSLQSFGKGALRVAKNYTKGYSDTQTKVREATSNDAWGPSGTQMNEIAQMTYSQNEFVEIMEMLDKRLNDKGKNWRHVFKALTLLDYCLHAGSENVVIYFKDNLYVIKTLKEFVYVDDDGKDVGANVRQKAKDITNLLQDEDRLRAERRSRGAMRDRMLGNIANSGLRGEGEDDFESPSRSESRPRPGKSRDEDEDLKKAIEESKRMTRDEESKRAALSQEEDDLRRAIRLSEEEDAKRKKEIEDANAKALFDDSQQVDLFSQQQQPQMPMMPTGGWPLVDAGWGQQQQQQLQPQYTSYNPFLQQQMMQQQQAQQQQEEYMRQQMQLAEQQRQQQEWMMMQQQQAQQQALYQQQQLQAQPTGYRSNNPFAPTAPQQTGMPFSGSGGGGTPTIGEPIQQSFIPSPISQPQSQQQSSTSTPQPQSSRPGFNPTSKKDDGEHSHLANLLANRDGGMDTFGNVGNLRIPIGSQFHPSNRLAVQQT